MNTNRLLKLAPLNIHRNWLLWRYRDVGRPKPAKIPFTLTGGPAAVDNPATWAALPAVLRIYERFTYSGIGYVLTAGAGIIGVDLDNCVDVEHGRIQAWALEILTDIDSYTEYSPSGTGVHILAMGALPCAGKRSGAIEMYQDGRYLAMTGDHVPGTPEALQDRGPALLRLYASLLPEPRKERVPTAGGLPAVTPDDDALLTRAMKARNGAKFSALWKGDDQGDASAGDLALANMLSYWAGGDAERVDRLFRRSARIRPKWDQVHYSDGLTYGQHTVLRACGEVVTNG